MVVLRSIKGVITPPMVSTPKRERGHIEQQDILDLATQHTSLDSCADCHNLIRVDAFVGFFVDHRLHQVLDHGHAGCATDQNNLIDL